MFPLQPVTFRQLCLHSLRMHKSSTCALQAQHMAVRHGHRAAQGEAPCSACDDPQRDPSHVGQAMEAHLPGVHSKTLPAQLITVHTVWYLKIGAKIEKK